MRLFSILRYLLVAALVAGLFVVSGCDDPNIPDSDIKSLIESAEFKQANTNDAAISLDTLVYYINLYPDLQDLMTGSVANTFFAPSNAAFQALKASPDFPTAPNALKLINKSLIRSVLTYHFSEGAKMRSELTPGLTLDSKFTDPLSSKAPQKITINADGTLKASPLAANVAITIKVADAVALNGVVHVIDAVMVPPSTGEWLFPSLGQVAGSILLAETFSNLTRVIMAADVTYTENLPTLDIKVTKWLAMPISSDAAPTANVKGITFFALSNTVFTEAMATTEIGRQDKGRAFLLNHLVVSTPGGAQTIGQYIVGPPPSNNPHSITRFADGQSINPMTGASKRIFVRVVQPDATVPTGVSISNNVSGTPPPSTSFKPILLGDQKAKNGYSHTISAALQ